MANVYGDKYVAILSDGSRIEIESVISGVDIGHSKRFVGLGTDGKIDPSLVSGGAGIGDMLRANNLSDVVSVVLARSNLGLGSAALLSAIQVAQTANNLSDLSSPGTARTNLGLGTAAVQNVGFFLQVANNLSDLANAATARTNLGLGALATVTPGAGVAALLAITNLTQTLADAASIAWNMNNGYNARVTLGGNRTLAAPTNLVDGGTYILEVIQDGTGSRTLAYNAVFKWPGASAPTLTTTAGAKDILTFWSDGTNLFGVSQLAFG